MVEGEDRRRPVIETLVSRMAFLEVSYHCSADGRWEASELPCPHPSPERAIAFQLKAYLFAAELEQVEVDFDPSDYIIRLKREERVAAGKVSKARYEEPGKADLIYEVVWQALVRLGGQAT